MGDSLSHLDDLLLCTKVLSICKQSIGLFVQETCVKLLFKLIYTNHDMSNFYTPYIFVPLGDRFSKDPVT